MERGKFIVFEGTDGTGKSANARVLYEYLTGKGIPCVLTFEPTDGDIGKLLREYLKGEKKGDEKAIAALFLADRLDHITKPNGLLETINKGTTVICDRYFLSSVAYNCPSEKAEYVVNMNKAATDLLSPDLTIYLDMPLEKLGERISKRGAVDIYENLEYQRKVKQRYDEGIRYLASPLVIVNSDRAKSDVASDIRRAVKKHLGL